MITGDNEHNNTEHGANPQNRFVQKLDFYEKQHTLVGHSDEIRVILFTHNNKSVFTGSWDHNINQYSINTSKSTIDHTPSFIFKGHTGSITSLALCPDEKYLISGSKDGSIKIWEIATGECCFTLTGHKEKVYTVTVDSKCKYILSAGEDKSVKIWQIETEHQLNKNRLDSRKKWISVSLLKTLEMPEASVHLIRISPDNKYIATIGDENPIYFWKFPSGKALDRLIGHEKMPYTFDFHPKGHYFVSAGKEKIIRFWDDNGNCIRKIHTNSKISHVRFSPDGRYFVAVSFKGKITVYESFTGRSIQEYTVDKGKRPTVGLSEDFNHIAVAPFQTGDLKTEIWNFFKA